MDFLKKQMEYNKADTAWFFSKKDPNWELSNMAGGMPVWFDDQKWNSSEQLYQASKYPLDAECVPTAAKTERGKIPNVRQRIAAATNARGAKMTQKCAVKAGLVRDDWDDPEWEVRIHSMLWVLELKLFHNRLNLQAKKGQVSFAAALKQTGGLPIVEISRKDDFWGCKDMGNGILKGSNVLGKLLVILREGCEKIRDKDFTYPEGFLLS